MLIGILVLSGFIPFGASYPTVRTPTLSEGGVNPSTGNTTTLFTFQVKYIDSNNTPPTAVYVYIDGQPHSMWWPGYNYTTGEWCYYWTRLSAGNHSYYFTAINSNGSYRLPSSGSYSLYVAPYYVPPRITLTSGSVTPRQGNTSTNFTFSVRYIHNKGWSPTFVNVVIDGVARNMSVPQGNFSSGISCTYTTNLSLGDHSYYFLASTPNTTGARYPSSGFLHVYVSNHLRRRIWICNNNELLWYVRTNGFRGNGTQDDPFIIENFEINMSSGGGCIYISNTTYYVVLRNLTLHHTDLSYSSFTRNTTIYLENLRYFRIEQCKLYAANVGIYLKDCGDVHIKENDFADGYPHRGMIGIYADNVDSLVVEDNTFRCSFEGIRIYRGRYISINSNYFSNPERDASLGISLYNGTNNVSVGMNLLKSIFYPLRVVNSHGITIFANNLSLSTYGGLYIRNSYNLTVTNNTLYNNAYGVYLTNSRGIHVYSNSFLNNSVQAWDDGSANSWNTYYPIGGNYWSDYSGRDNFSGPGQNISGSDGIGDTPYRIPGGNNYDHYPILTPPTTPTAFLYNGGVFPSSGDTSTLFTFFVTYRHPEGVRPLWVKVHLTDAYGSPLLDSLIMTVPEGDYREGVNCTATTGLPSGVVFYYFEAVGSIGWQVRYPEEGALHLTVHSSNASAVLTNSSVTPQRGTSSTLFTFQTYFRDTEGRDPEGVFVFLDPIEAEGREEEYIPVVYELKKLYETSQGVCYGLSREITLQSGYIQVWFEAEDRDHNRVRDPAEGDEFIIYVERTEVLKDPEISPGDWEELNSSTAVNISIVYIDPFGRVPDYVGVDVDGVTYTMLPTGRNYTRGVSYFYISRFTPGNHILYFEAKTGDRIYRYPEENIVFYVERGAAINHPPQLTGGVRSALEGENVYIFYATYLDMDWDPPISVTLHIDGAIFGMRPVTDPVWGRGVKYEIKLNLSREEHKYYFTATDSMGGFRKCPESGTFILNLSGAAESERSPSPPRAVIRYSLNGFNAILDGSGSYDPDGRIIQYTWTVDGQFTTGMVTQYTLSQGYHRIELIVMDNDGLTDRWEMILLVGEEGEGWAVRVAGTVILGYGEEEIDEGEGYHLVLREIEDGRAVISVSSEEGGAGVVVLYINRSIVRMGEIALTLDGKPIERLSPAEIANNPEMPAYTVVEKNGEIQVILYLPDIDRHTIVISSLSESAGKIQPSTNSLLFYLILGVVVLLTTLVSAVFAISRRRHTANGFLLSDEEGTSLIGRSVAVNWDDFIEE